MSTAETNSAPVKISNQPRSQDAHRQRLNLALTAGRAGTFDWDVKNNSVTWSDELRALYGISQGEISCAFDDWLALVVPEDRQLAGSSAINSLHTGEFEVDFRIRRSDNGEIRWMHSRGTVSFDEVGQPVTMLGINVDITDLKNAQEKSAASERRFQSILDTESVGVLFLDRAGRIIGANNPFLHMTGYSYDEIHSGSLSWRQLTPPEWFDVTEEQMTHMSAIGRIGPYEKEFLLKDGSRRWMRFTGRDMGDGTIAEYCFDIHDQKQAEHALRESEAKYRALFDSMDEGYILTEVIFDADGKPADILYLEANAAAIRMTGKPLAGRRVTQISPNFEPHWFESFGRVCRTGIGERHEFPVAPLNALYDIFIFRVGLPQANRVAAVYRDITDRRRHEEALQRSEERFRFIGERAQVGYWDWDLPSDCLEWSPQCKKLFGIPVDEPVDYSRFLAALHPDDRERTRQAVSACLQSAGAKEYDIQYRALWPDRTVHWIRSKGAANFRNGAPQRMAGIVIDISESKHVEQALEQTMEVIRETEAQFRTLAESVPQLVWTCDASGKCDYLNSQWADYTGVPLEQQLGYRWLERLHPEDRDNTIRHWQESLQASTVFDVEFRLQNSFGRYRWFKTRAYPHRGPFGNVTKWFGTCTDIEDQKRTEGELRRANTDLQQFAYSASHDLKQTLRNMVIYGQLLQRKAASASQLDAEADHLIDVIVKNGQRTNQLLSNLLAYASAASGGNSETPSSTDSRAVLQNVISDLQLSITENCAQITADPLPVVGVSETHLQQLLQNLMSNAIKYRKQSEPPRLHLTAAPHSPHFWQFSLADNGIGIDAEHHSQIFDLFTRLHESSKYEGSGLGLAICRRIVERYGGRIWLESELGKGTTFHFTLPCA